MIYALELAIKCTDHNLCCITCLTSKTHIMYCQSVDKAYTRVICRTLRTSKLQQQHTYTVGHENGTLFILATTWPNVDHFAFAFLDELQKKLP